VFQIKKKQFSIVTHNFIFSVGTDTEKTYVAVHILLFGFILYLNHKGNESPRHKLCWSSDIIMVITKPMAGHA
jgi:hypothetical protein